MLESEASLKKEFPQSTRAERLRFIQSFKTIEESSNRLADYMAFRSVHGLDRLDCPKKVDELNKKYGIDIQTYEGDSLRSGWDLCFCLALEASQQIPSDSFYPDPVNSRTNRRRRKPDTPKKLEDSMISPEELRKFRIPIYVQTYSTPCGNDALTKNGGRVLHIVPARIDPAITSMEVHGLALTYLLVQQLDRFDENLAEVHMMVDIRRGEGWPNLMALKLLPLCRIIAKTFLTLHPGRMEHCLAYPLPGAATLLFNLFKGMLPKAERDKVHVISGPDSPYASPPKEIMKYVDEDTVNSMEQYRKDTYGTIRRNSRYSWWNSNLTH